MKNKIYSSPNNLILFATILILTFVFSIDQASAHKKKNHKVTICIPEEDRTKQQLQHDKTMNWLHRLSKLQQDCAILEIEKQKGEITDLEDALGGIANCGDIPFNHKSTSKTKVYQKPDAKSNVVAEVKKGQELLFISPSQKDKNWYYVKVRKDKGCGDGYIQQKFVSKKISVDTTVIVGPKLIKIIEPSWAKEGKLILIDAKGRVSIIGAIQEGVYGIYGISKHLFIDELTNKHDKNIDNFIMIIRGSNRLVRFPAGFIAFKPYNMWLYILAQLHFIIEYNITRIKLTISISFLCNKSIFNIVFRTINNTFIIFDAF